MMSVVLSDITVSLQQVEAQLLVLQFNDVDRERNTCTNILSTCGLITVILEDLLGVGDPNSDS